MYQVGGKKGRDPPNICPLQPKALASPAPTPPRSVPHLHSSSRVSLSYGDIVLLLLHTRMYDPLCFSCFFCVCGGGEGGCAAAASIFARLALPCLLPTPEKETQQETEENSQGSDTKLLVDTSYSSTLLS